MGWIKFHISRPFLWVASTDSTCTFPTYSTASRKLHESELQAVTSEYHLCFNSQWHVSHLMKYIDKHWLSYIQCLAINNVLSYCIWPMVCSTISNASFIELAHCIEGKGISVEVFFLSLFTTPQKYRVTFSPSFWHVVTDPPVLTTWWIHSPPFVVYVFSPWTLLFASSCR